MSTDVDFHLQNVALLLGEIQEQAVKKNVSLEGKMTFEEFVDKVLPKFGVVHDGMLYTVSNEHASDYNPAWQLNDFIGRYYGLGYFYASSYKFGISHANADDVADELGIELADEEEE
jgi:hypothetical protein